MPKILNQKGIIDPKIIVVGIVALVIIFFLATGSFKGSISRNNQPASQTEEQTPAQKEKSSEIEWETYKDELGYSLKHPKGWSVENVPSENSRLIKISSDDKLAFVLIEAIAGNSLEKEGEVEEVVKMMEEKLKKDEDLKVTNSDSKTEAGIGGYIAVGEYLDDGKESSEDKKIIFEERFKVAKNGNGLRIHAAYPKVTKDINKPITTEIINSFSTN